MKNLKSIFFFCALIFCIFLCSCQQHLQGFKNNLHARLPGKKAFAENINGEETQLIYLKNKNNLQAAITNYGARLVSLLVPDRDENFISVVVGFDSIKNYINAHAPYYGATIGRYANRIADGKLIIDNKLYQLSINNNTNTNHGGKNGFNNKVWRIIDATANSVKLTYFSKDMEEGFPGNLSASVIYTLTDDNELKISYGGSTDKKTVVNFTNHAFFNLNGEGNELITDHILKINAEKFTPINDRQLPTGEFKSVENTPFDFRSEREIGRSINDNDLQVKYGSGYDHNFILNKTSGAEFQLAAIVSSPHTGIVMEVFTDQPGVHFFTANAFKGLDTGRTGKPILFRSAFCLETQHFPDSQNHLNFPTTILSPREIYKTETVYKFSVQR